MSFVDGGKQKGIKDILNSIIPMQTRFPLYGRYVGSPLNFQFIYSESIRETPTMPQALETEVNRATRGICFPKYYIQWVTRQ